MTDEPTVRDISKFFGINAIAHDGRIRLEVWAEPPGAGPDVYRLTIGQVLDLSEKLSRSIRAALETIL